MKDNLYNQRIRMTPKINIILSKQKNKKLVSLAKDLSSKLKTKNIHFGKDEISNYILFSGEIFSFDSLNKTLAEYGFKLNTYSSWSK